MTRTDHATSTTLTGTYDAQDRLTAWGDFEYTYDANGDLGSRTDSVTSDVTTFDYDALGNLLQVVLHEGEPNERVIAYKVDGLGRRVQKRVDGVVAESYLYGQGLLPVAQLDASGNVVSVFGPGFMKQGGQTYAVLTDHLGSPRLVVNAATGFVTQRMEYDEFGRVLLDSITPDIQGYKPLPFGFAGGLYDRDTNLVRFGARDYDPEVGRWTTKDPILFAGGDGNLYGYCVNDPVNFYDPLGLTENYPDWWNPSDWIKYGLVAPFTDDYGAGLRDAVDHNNQIANELGIPEQDADAVKDRIDDLGTTICKAIIITPGMISKAVEIAPASKIRELEDLINEFGGTRRGWRKMKTWDAHGREIHYYFHKGIGAVKRKYK